MKIKNNNNKIAINDEPFIKIPHIKKTPIINSNHGMTNAAILFKE